MNDMKSLTQFILENMENISMDDFTSLFSEITPETIKKKTKIKNTTNYFDEIHKLYDKNFDKKFKRADLGSIEKDKTYLIIGGTRSDNTCYIIKVDNVNDETFKGTIITVLKDKLIFGANSSIEYFKFDKGLWSYYEIPEEISKEIFKS